MAIEIIRAGVRVMQKNCVLWVKREQHDGEIGIHFSVTEKWARQVRIENDNCKT